MATIKSIEEKARAYDEALVYAKKLLKTIGNATLGNLVLKNEFKNMFPALKESEDEKIRKELITHCRNTRCVTEEGAERIVKWISWLEKQGNLMKALQISNARIGELIEKNYYLKEQFEKQGNNMGISEATKQKLEDNLNKALEKETAESWNKFLDEQGEQKMKTPEESLGVDSDTYNKIVDECIYGEQKPIKEHNACEFCEDRYGCVNPCSMKLIEEQKPIGEYNITGIGSKHATGKLAEKIKEFDEKTKELKLLKQGEQKPFGQRDECLHCQFNYDGECKGFCAMKRSNRKPHKPTDKVEHKFKVGDEIRTGNDESLTITKIDEKGYWSENLFICDFDEECIWDLVEQKSTDKTESRQYELTEFEKAVKQVMEEAIECGDTHNLKADADMLLRLVQKSSWSEEDEEQLDRALYMMEQLNMTKSWDDVYNWLKSFKERVKPQKQEWSEEDIELIDNTIKFIEDRVAATSPSLRTYSPTLTGKEIPFLKALKDRYTWRPSDEQMDALRYVTNFDYGGYKATLVSLYEQLKKLRGE